MDDFRQHGFQHFAAASPSQPNPIARCWHCARGCKSPQGKFDDAIETLRAGYGWSRNWSHAPSIIQCFIGCAFHTLLNPQTCTLIGQENSPNLYWALTDLALEPIDFHEALSYESKIWEFSLHGVEDLDRRILTAEEVNKLAEEIPHIVSRRGERTLRQRSSGRSNWSRRPGNTCSTMVTRRKSSMPCQCCKWRCCIAGGNSRWCATIALSFCCCPMPIRLDGRPEPMKRCKAAYARGEGTPFTNLLPAIHAATYARLRSMRQVNLLRTVEALRMYAAEHGRGRKSWTTSKRCRCRVIRIPRSRLSIP